jgi:hypothetical protein
MTNPKGAGSSATEQTGFTEEQRGELAKMIADAVTGAGSTEGDGTKGKTGGEVSDKMPLSDQLSLREMQRLARETVDLRLGELARDKEIADLKAALSEQEAARQSETEKPPTVISKLTAFLWGHPEEEEGQ